VSVRQGKAGSLSPALITRAMMPDARNASVARCMTAARSGGMRFAEASLIPLNVSSSAISFLLPLRTLP